MSEVAVAVAPRRKSRSETSYFNICIYFTTGKKAFERHATGRLKPSYYPAGWRADDRNEAAQRRAVNQAKDWCQHFLNTTDDRYSGGAIYDQRSKEQVASFDKFGNINWMI